MIRINIIGAGRLGKTLAYLMVKQGLVQIGGIVNTSVETTQDAIQFIGQGIACASIAQLPAADVTFITTPDKNIIETGRALALSPALKSGSVVVHCSGALGADILSFVKEKHCWAVSVHPMHSFARPEISILQYQTTYCAIEGDEEAFPVVESLFNPIGSICYKIPAHKKSLYHAAGVFASNYLVTLAQVAFDCLLEVGLEQPLGKEVLAHIMQNTLNNLSHASHPIHALTGPVQRGDTAVISQHEKSFSSQQHLDLYMHLAKTTLSLKKQFEPLSDLQT